jgi:FSR family fosmidomycin resistance protein-like MFS transporter
VGGDGVLILLVIEFLDELVYGAREAAWPLIRSDFGLTYSQIGLLLALPLGVSTLIGPVLGVLSDTGKRRALVLGGGIVFATALLLTGASPSYGGLLASFVLLSPASGV